MINYGTGLFYFVWHDTWRGCVGNHFTESGMGNLERVAMEGDGGFSGAVSGAVFRRCILFDRNYLERTALGVSFLSDLFPILSIFLVIIHYDTVFRICP